MKLSRFARTTLQFGFGLAAICLLLAVGLHFFVPYCQSPHSALVLLRSFREATLALAATTVCTALLCDIILKKDFPK